MVSLYSKEWPHRDQRKHTTVFYDEVFGERRKTAWTDKYDTTATTQGMDESDKNVIATTRRYITYVKVTC